MLVSGLLFVWALGLCLIVPAIILAVLIVALRNRDPSGMAIFSLVTGILGFILLPITGSAAAIISGNMALSAYRLRGQPDQNENLARAGVILGWISLALWILGTIGIFLFFYPVTSIRSGG